MIFLLLATSFLLSHATDVSKYDGHQVLKIFPKTKADADFVFNLIERYGLDLWHFHTEEKAFDVRLHPEVLDKVKEELAQANIYFHTWISNVQTLIDNQHTSTRTERAASGKNLNLNTYHSYPEIVDYIVAMSASNSSHGVVSTHTDIGVTSEGRTIIKAKIFKPSATPKPVIVVDGGIHAREWISPAFVLYLIDQLKNNPARQQLVEDFDWHIIPVLNPDGYSYSRTNERLWRKNRRVNAGSSCHGVDLNRNFQYQWNPAIGGSTSACSDIYAGVGALSEAESRNLDAFLRSVEGTAISYLTVHSYGQMWLYPWGYTSTLPSDWQELDAAAQSAITALRSVHNTRYTVGSSTNVLYSAAGGSDDHAKGINGIKYSYTLELRDTGRYGFVLPESQIQPTCEETMEAFNAFANSIKPSTRKIKMFG